MKIGIIGAGHIGGALTRRLRALGHDVLIANSRGPETLRAIAGETGATAATVSDAARDVAMLIIAIPEKAVRDLPKDVLAASNAETVVVDIGNYYPRQRDGRIDGIEGGETESRWVSRQLGRPVVKAFNTIYARHLMELGRPAGDPARIALPVAGDEPDAKSMVISLLDELGFDGVDAGALDESWRQQPGTPVYGADLDAAGVTRALADARPRRLEEFSASDD